MSLEAEDCPKCGGLGTIPAPTPSWPARLIHCPACGGLTCGGSAYGNCAVMDHKSAHRLAEKIKRELSPYCARIEIAGSIRRRRPECGDIDLVILPNNHFIETRAGILKRVKEKCQIKTGDSPEALNTICTLPNGFQLDLFFARHPSHDLFAPIPGNFGSLFLCRTGSMQHNIQLCERAKGMGYHYDSYRGIIDAQGAIIASETEEDIYKSVGLQWRPPEQRETL